MKSNIEKMGDSLMSRMVGTNQALRPLGIELGVIQSNLSLSPDTSPGPIPKGEYLISRGLSLGSEGDVFARTQEGQGTHGHGPSGAHGQYSGTGVHTHPASEGAHVHDVLLPESMRGLKSGDRVLICWAGYTAIVVDVVLTS